MPMKREIDMEEFRSMARWQKPLKPVEEVAAAVKDGSKLVLEESTFSDPGGDYSAVYLDGENVLYIPGY